MSVFTGDWPNRTETMAERAWRYGEHAEPGEFLAGWIYGLTVYADRSALLHFVDDTPATVIPNWDHEGDHA